MRRVVLCDSYEQVLALRKGMARDAGRSSLGVLVSTPKSFVGELWEVWGDGRVLVSDVQRLTLFLSLLPGNGQLADTLGMARALADFTSYYAGCAALVDALDAFAAEEVSDADAANGELDEAERAFLSVVRTYFGRLEQRGLIESGQACARLAELGLHYSVEFAEAPLLMPAMRALLMAWCTQDAGEASFSLPAPSAGVGVSFLLPAGPTAMHAVMRDEIERQAVAVSDGDVRIAVVVPDPKEACDALAPTLAEAGFRSSYRASMSFARSRFGCAWLASRMLVKCDAHWRVAACDFAASPLSGMTSAAARKLDATVRGNRLLACEQACELLHEASPTFASFERLHADEPGSALDALRAMARRWRGVPPHELRLEAALLDALELLDDAAASVGAGRAEAARASEALAARIAVSFAAAQGSGADSDTAGCGASVCFMSAAQAGLLAPGSFDAVIVGDLSEAAFDTAEQGISTRGLAERLGLARRESMLEVQRRRLAGAIAACRTHLTCIVPLHDASREATLPSFLLNELLAVLPHRNGPKGAFSIPLQLVDDRGSLGEDVLPRCVGRAAGAAEGGFTLRKPQRGMLAETRLIDCIRTVWEPGGVLPVLSPSALEAYLGCPYSWFVGRFVRPGGLDEEFGPLEQGTFAHEVFARFYNGLAGRGIVRVMPRGASESAIELGDALAELDKVFDSCLREQPALEPCSGRLVPLRQAERLAVEQLRTLFREALVRQSRFAPGYRVLCHERVIAPEDGIDYAGARLNGRIDRIDVNDGPRRFAILDYKGTVAGHAAGFKNDEDAESFALPRKIQALVYAQAARRLLGKSTCAAALYLAYRAKWDSGFAAGSFDEAAFDAGGLTTAASKVEMSFDVFLDMIEDKMAPHVEALKAGDIARRPAGKEACAHCLLPWCDRRA